MAAAGVLAFKQQSFENRRIRIPVSIMTTVSGPASTGATAAGAAFPDAGESRSAASDAAVPAASSPGADAAGSSSPAHALPGPSRAGYAFAAATVCIWAGFVLLSRLAGTTALNGNDLVALRFGVAAAILLPAWWFRWRVPLFTRRMATLMVFGGMAYTLLAYWSFRFAPAAHGAVLLSGVLPFFVALVTWVLLKQAPSYRVRQALFCIGAGVGCLALHSLGGLAQSWPGDLMMVAASLSWAIYTVLVRRWGFSPAETTIGVTLLSALLFLPVYAWLLPRGIDATPWSSILLQGFYQGVLVAIVAMVLYMQALARLGPLRLGTVMATVPAIAGIGATLLLGEPFSLWLLGGLVLTSFGAWLGTR